VSRPAGDLGCDGDGDDEGLRAAAVVQVVVHAGEVNGLGLIRVPGEVQLADRADDQVLDDAGPVLGGVLVDLRPLRVSVVPSEWCRLDCRPAAGGVRPGRAESRWSNRLGVAQRGPRVRRRR
jgi:hypothetical protein